MHILMLTQFFAPVVGGIERHVLTLSQQLVARGHCVSVATLWQDGLAEAESLQGIQVHRLKATTHLLPRGVFADGGRVYPPPLPDPRIMVGLQELVATGRPDIIHAHNWFIYSYLPLKALHRLPVVETLHDYHLRCPKWTMIQGDHECSGPQLAKCLGCSARHFGAFKGVATVLSSRASGLLEERGVDKFFAVSRSVALKSGLTVGRAPYMCIPNFVRDEVAQITDDV
ncbi:MAG TPA: glycosyltransferase family 4 protein, partial [Chloroflexaceae bacterium]|nr:glycosyltransferase family 4 protein [Chloroflexaceae bacterium]